VLENVSIHNKAILFWRIRHLPPRLQSFFRLSDFKIIDPHWIHRTWGNRQIEAAWSAARSLYRLLVSFDKRIAVLRCERTPPGDDHCAGFGAISYFCHIAGWEFGRAIEVHS
jgi:hypothetical protein